MPTIFLPSAFTIRSFGSSPTFSDRAARDDIHHDNGIAQDVEFDADTAETAVEHLLDAFHLLGGQVGRVGVQLQQHFADRFFDQCVVVDRIYVCAVQVAVKTG